MAKRRRLDVMPREGVAPDPGADGPRGSLGPGFAAAPSVPPARAPIGQVSGEASALAALDEVAGVLRAAQDEGRMVLSLPLDAIVEDHLIRDRIELEPDEMTALMQSLLQRGQQTPAEVTDLGAGRWGLISGWRRLKALRELFGQTGDPRFARILALPRRATEGSAAYVAMVEENEIRVGLSFYERARIVMRATEAQAFATEKEALQSLFAAASYAKRSKVKSFIPVVAALDAALRFPTHIGERTGLALCKALEASPGFAPRLAQVLAAAAPATPEAEAAVLAQALKTPKSDPVLPGSESEIVPGVILRRGSRRLTLDGPGVTPDLADRLVAWLRETL